MAIKQELKDENGNLHCEDAPALIREMSKGTEYEWYKHGVKHRIGGPAIESPNYTEYWVEGQLHRDGGPSIVYHAGDENGVGVGQKLFHLHGVIVPEHIVMASENDFNRKWFLEEQNAEVRREIIRKFGIERIFKITKKAENKLRIGEAKVLNADGDYELWRGRLTEETYGTYLKMKNPSIGVWHLEGVSPECTTVGEALKWRNHGLENRPVELS